MDYQNNFKLSMYPLYTPLYTYVNELYGRKSEKSQSQNKIYRGKKNVLRFFMVRFHFVSI